MAASASVQETVVNKDALLYAQDWVEMIELTEQAGGEIVGRWEPERYCEIRVMGLYQNHRRHARRVGGWHCIACGAGPIPAGAQPGEGR
jgi:hypothetical protein